MIMLTEEGMLRAKVGWKLDLLHQSARCEWKEKVLERDKKYTQTLRKEISLIAVYKDIKI